MDAAAETKKYTEAKVFKQEIDSLLSGNGAQPKEEINDVEPSKPVSNGPAEVRCDKNQFPALEFVGNKTQAASSGRQHRLLGSQSMQQPCPADVHSRESIYLLLNVDLPIDHNSKQHLTFSSCLKHTQKIPPGGIDVVCVII